MAINKKSTEDLLLDLYDKFNIEKVVLSLEKRNIKDNDFSIWYTASSICHEEKMLDIEEFQGSSYTIEGALQQLLKDCMRFMKPIRVKRIKLEKELYDMEGMVRYE